MTILSRRAALCGAAASLFAPGMARAADSNVLSEAMQDTAVPGMAAMLIRNFRPEREIVAGIRRLGANDSVRRGDRWYLGSDAKAMTATLIAVLAEQGVLSWQTPLAGMLPSLADTMDPAYRDVTLPDLLSHRAGLSPDMVSVELFLTFYEDTAPLSEQRLRYVAAALAQPPSGPKRAEHLYSNTSYYIAAAIAEHATKREYEDLMQSHVFGPLRMRSVRRERVGAAEEPIGHTNGRQADRYGGTADNPPDLEPDFGSPSHGGIRLSLRDWSRFCIDQMRGEHGVGRLLRGESYRFLHQAQGDTRYGLGWYTQQSVYRRQGPAIYHSGSDGNWMAQVVLFPRIGDGALVVANSAYGMDGNTVSETVLRQLCQTLSEPAPAN